tara:strand:+ start:779 stop:937 length:159 start_codon:yes stop_codon:yes gene_type:complete
MMRHKSGFQPEITPGMPLFVNILGDKPTVMNYIVTLIKKFIETSVSRTFSLG